MNQNIEKLFDSLRDVDNVAYHLESLANSFGATGNDVMEVMLNSMHKKLNRSTKSIRGAFIGYQKGTI